MLPSALTVAGSDPSGGAGIQADLKTFHRFGVYGQSAITLVTVQNTCGVRRVEVLDVQLVLDQLEAVVLDITPRAAKTGALGSASVIRAIAERAATLPFPLVVDPVMISKNGAPLVDTEGAKAYRALIERAHLVTPNIPEAAELTGRTVRDVSGMRDAARALCDMGAHAALVKGGHLDGSAIDVLLLDGASYEFAGERIPTRHTHGTGCTYSAAITAGVALGHDLHSAIARAKEFVTAAILTNPGLGSSCGPLNHWA